MKQLSSVPFGPDATKLAGYAQYAGGHLGNLTLLLENTGDNSLYFQLKEYVGTTLAPGAASGYQAVGSAVTVVAKGTTALNYNLVSKRIGFFGSGNTIANVTVAFRNPADLRGAQIDVVATGRRGWGLDDAFNAPELTKGWGGPPDSPLDVTPGEPS